MSIEDHLLIARKAVKYALDIITLGSSNRKESSVTYSQICELRNKLIALQVIDRYDISSEKLQKTVEIIKNYKIGNCYEHTLLAYYFVINSYNADAHIIDCSNIDHSFLLIGAKDPKNVQSWGEVAVVCDPWDNRYYPAKYSLIFLKEYFGYLTRLSIEGVQCIQDNNSPRNNHDADDIDSDKDNLKELINFSESYNFNLHHTTYPYKLAGKGLSLLGLGFFISQIVFGNFESNINSIFGVMALISIYILSTNSLINDDRQQKRLVDGFTLHQKI